MSYEDQSHRFVITGEDPEGHPRTILGRETDLVHGKVIRRVPSFNGVTSRRPSGDQPMRPIVPSWPVKVRSSRTPSGS